MSLPPEHAQPSESESSPARRVQPTNPFVRFEPEDVEQSVAARFEQQVARYGDRLAVRDGLGTLTYRELNRAANRAAHASLSRGQRGGRAAVLCGHGAPAVIGMLGALKAGLAYVPLDPNARLASLNAIVEDADPSVVLTDRANGAQAAHLVGDRRPIIVVDAPGGGLDDADPNLPVEPDTPACILYGASGSGQPKGVVQTHRTLLQATLRATNSHHVSAEDRLALLAPYTDPMALMTTNAALLNGAALLPYSLRDRDIAGVGDWLEREEITIFHSLPAVFRRVAAAAGDGRSFPSLRLIHLSGRGDRRDFELYRRFRPGCLLASDFWTAETLLSRVAYLDQASELAGSLLPAGYEVEGVDVLLTGEDGRPVEPGAAGELVILGQFLSPGYWHRPELTAAAFATHPRDRAIRAFQTGELGRLRADGWLERLGPKEPEVRIGGQPAEPTEVELALLGIAGVREAVAVGRRDRRGEDALLAYVAADEGALPAEEAIRTTLAERLPRHMLPAAIVRLDALPVTAGGEIDRSKLPEPRHERRAVERVIVAPRNELETQLASLWEHLLGVQPVGVTEDFFDLGGTAPLARRLLAEIGERYGRSIPSSALFPTATIERLAPIVGGPPSEAPAGPLVPIQRRGALPPFFCVHPIEGDLLSYARLSHHLGADQPFYGLELPGVHDARPAFTSVESLAGYYVETIREQQPNGPYHVGGWSFGGAVAYEVARQIREEGEEVALLAILDQAAPGSGYWSVERSPASIARLLGSAAAALPDGLRELRQALARPGGSRRPAQRRADAPAGSAPALDAERLPADQRRAWQRLHESVQGRPEPERPRWAGLVQALTRFRPRPYPGAVTLFRARRQPLLCSHDPLMGWGGLAEGGIEVRVVPGDHIGIVREPAVRVLAAELRDALQRARTRRRQSPF